MPKNIAAMCGTRTCAGTAPLKRATAPFLGATVAGGSSTLASPSVRWTKYSSLPAGGCAGKRRDELLALRARVAAGRNGSLDG